MRENLPVYDPSASYPLVDGTKWAAVCFFAIIILVIIGPMLTPKDAALTGEGNIFRQLSYILLFGALIVATFRQRALERALLTSLPVNLLLLWCWLSVLWAISPSISVRRLVLTTIIIYATFTYVISLGYERTARSIRQVFTVVLILNLLTVILRPQVGIHQFEFGGDPSLIGDWRGIFPEKNLAGSITAMTIIMYIFAEQPKKMFHYLIILASVLFLYKTGSKTSLGITGMSIMLGAIYIHYDHRLWPVAMTLFSLIAIGCMAVVYANLDAINLMLDDQDSFTGRSQIWSMLLAYIGDNWLLGAGYGSFWNVGPESPIYDYARNGSWLDKVASGHNGYLDLTSQLGLPGLVLVVFALLVHPLGRLLTMPALKARGPLLTGMLFFCLGQNFTESTMLDRDQVVQFCLMWTIACICGAGETPEPHRTAEHSEAAKATNGPGAQAEGSP